MANARKTLNGFYEAYLDWLDSGAEDGANGMIRAAGLCTNLLAYLGTDDRNDKAYTLFQYDLLAAGLDTITPFNADVFDYLTEANGGECYLNPERRAFVEYMLRTK